MKAALCFLAIVLPAVLLAACSEEAPDAAKINALFEEAEQAVLEIPAAYHTSIYALVTIAAARADAQGDEAARAAFESAKARVRAHGSGDAAYWRGISLSHIAAAEARLGHYDAASETASASLQELTGISDTHRRAVVLIEEAGDQAAVGAVEAAIDFLGAGMAAARTLPDGWQRSALFREAASVYRAIGVPERGRDALSEAESGAWLEEDARQNAVSLMRLAEGYARLDGADEARAIMAVLPTNFRDPVRAALVQARIGAADIATSEIEAAALVYPYSKARTFTAVAEHHLTNGAAEQARAAALKAMEAARGDTEGTRVIEYYALAHVLVRTQDLDGAAKVLMEAAEINREQGNFWNINEFSDANVALAAAGKLDAALQLAQSIEKEDQRDRELAKLEVVRASIEAGEGRYEAAIEIARAIEHPRQRSRALLAVIAASTAD